MKKINHLTLIALALFAFAKSAIAEDEKPKEVAIGISDVYVPGGFDSDSDSFVVTNGIFPNGCYKYSRSEVTHVNNNVHEIKSFANVRQGMCIMVLVPFNKEVRLGKLSSGKHSLKFLNGDGTYLEKQLVIE